MPPADLPFFEVARAQRACRSFAHAPVPDSMVEQILDAATHAPSAENSQPWVFVVVREPDRRERIGALTRRLWREGARDFSSGRVSQGLFADVDRGAQERVAAAPVLVVVAADTEAVLEPVLAASVFPAIQNLLLGANALGLGSALTTLPTYGGEELAAIVELPRHVRPVAVVPIGVPARPLGPPRRRPVAACTHRERFGAGW